MLVQLKPVQVQFHSSDPSGHSGSQLHLTALPTQVPSAHSCPHSVLIVLALLLAMQSFSSLLLQSSRVATTLTLKRVFPGRPTTSRSLGPRASQWPALELDGWQVTSSHDHVRLKDVGPVKGQEVEKETSREPDSVAVTWKR